MRTGAEVIAAWEAGQGRHALDRALLLAAAAAPDASWEALCRLPIGARDRLLLELRAAMSGDRLPCYAACPACGAGFELHLSAGALHVDVRAVIDDGGFDGDVAWEDFRAKVRAPDSFDLAALVRVGSPAAGVTALVARCAEVRRGDEPVDANALPDPLLEAIAARMAALDPGAELLFNLTCVDCGQPWSARLDIAEYLWNEVSTRAHAVLRDVDLLARVYGWTEPEVLALSELRRHAYLELARS